MYDYYSFWSFEVFTSGLFWTAFFHLNDSTWIEKRLNMIKIRLKLPWYYNVFNHFHAASMLVKTL